MTFEPVVRFFVLGLAADWLRSDLKSTAVLYETAAIFLLGAIGLKGGMELAKQPLMTGLPRGLATVLAGALIPLVVHDLGKPYRPDGASLVVLASTITESLLRMDAQGVRRSAWGRYHNIRVEGYRRRELDRQNDRLPARSLRPERWFVDVHPSRGCA